jgi:hypothetical protein
MPASSIDYRTGCHGSIAAIGAYGNLLSLCSWLCSQTYIEAWKRLQLHTHLQQPAAAAATVATSAAALGLLDHCSLLLGASQQC